MAKRGSPALELIGRLEDKVKRLVGLVERLRTEHTSVANQNRRLKDDLDTLRANLADAERANTDVTTLRTEREQIRTRVTDILERLEAIHL
jgi:FtsZ-binding cell division protein ZapB